MKPGHKAFLLILLFHLSFNLGACAPRKTKTLVDRVYELDPSGRLYIHPQLEVSPPRSLAVLPFRSLVGEGRVEGSQAFLLTLRGKQKASPEVLAKQMRLSFFGQLAQLPFEHIHPTRVDTLLEAEGLTSWDNIKALTHHELENLLGADAVVFGEVTHFDYIYGFLYTQIAAGLRLEMISTNTGETLWRFNDTRRNHTLRVALDPVSLAVGLFQAGFSLRSINMTRSMDEICREAVATIPQLD
ncbi:MAG: DUF799 family lipoprotein [Desulfobacteraceae bacterium]|jgi:hypothetical protein